MVWISDLCGQIQQEKNDLGDVRPLEDKETADAQTCSARLQMNSPQQMGFSAPASSFWGRTRQDKALRQVHYSWALRKTMEARVWRHPTETGVVLTPTDDIKKGLAGFVCWEPLQEVKNPEQPVYYLGHKYLR